MLFALVSPGFGPPGPTVHAQLTGLLSVALGGLASTITRTLTSWIVDGTVGFLSGLGAVIDGTTDPAFGQGFAQVLAEVARVGAALALPFLLLAAIQAIVRQDLGLLLKAAFVRLPLALLLASSATELVSLGLGLTDQFCGAIEHLGGPTPQQFVGTVGVLLAGFAPAGMNGGFAALFLALVAIAVATLLWLELAVRSAAVAVAALFLPLALAGLVWSATAHWARRLGETLAALILSKLVIVAVLTLSASTFANVTGINGLVESVALLLLAAVSPFSLLRLVPMVEAGTIGHLEGMGRRGARLAVAGARTVHSGYQQLGEWRSQRTGIGAETDAVPYAHGQYDPDDPEVRAMQSVIEEERRQFAERDGDGGGGGA